MNARSCYAAIWQILIFVIWMIFALGVLPPCGVAGEIKSGKPRVLKHGLTAYAFDISASGNSGNEIIFIESGKTEYSPRIIGGTDQIGSLSYDFPAALAELIFDDAPVVVSGAYSQRIGGALLPLGYLKSRSVEISSRLHHSWLEDTVFCSDPPKSKSGIFSVADFENKRNIRKEFSDCVQTGPRLFKNGKNVIESQEDKDEARQQYIDTSRIQLFLCKADDDPTSSLGVGITTGKVGLSDLNIILSNLKIDKRNVCRNAVALSGSISAGMLINGKLVAGSGSYLLSSSLAFVREGGPPSHGGSSRKERAQRSR